MVLESLVHVGAIVSLKDLCCFSVEVGSEVKAVFKLGDKQCDDAIHKADPEATLPAEESSTPFPTTTRHFVRPFPAPATSVCENLYVLCILAMHASVHAASKTLCVSTRWLKRLRADEAVHTIPSIASVDLTGVNRLR